MSHLMSSNVMKIFKIHVTIRGLQEQNQHFLHLRSCLIELNYQSTKQLRTIFPLFCFSKVPSYILFLTPFTLSIFVLCIYITSAMIELQACQSSKLLVYYFSLLELSCCKKWKKKSQPRNWFGE